MVIRLCFEPYFCSKLYDHKKYAAEEAKTALVAVQTELKELKERLNLA